MYDFYDFGLVVHNIDKVREDTGDKKKSKKNKPPLKRGGKRFVLLVRIV